MLNSELYENIDKYDSDELSGRVTRGCFTEEAHIIACKILQNRGVTVPEIVSDLHQEDGGDKNIIQLIKSFAEKHPYWFGVICIFVSKVIHSIYNYYKLQ
jgi:hypothetical protein